MCIRDKVREITDNCPCGAPGVPMWSKRACYVSCGAWRRCIGRGFIRFDNRLRFIAGGRGSFTVRDGYRQISVDIGRFVMIGGVVDPPELSRGSGYALMSISTNLYRLARPAG